MICEVTAFIVPNLFYHFRGYLEKNLFILEVKCNMTIKGKYTAVGRLLLFPINGEGDSKIKIGNYLIYLKYIELHIENNTKYS